MPITACIVRELTDVQFLVLAFLRRAPGAHAYAVWLALSRQYPTESVSSQAVYRAFAKLEAEGLITSVGREEESARIEKVFYDLTPQGESALACERQRRLAIISRATGPGDPELRQHAFASNIEAEQSEEFTRR